MTSITDLYNNIITLVNKYFYKTKEKPAKYEEWLISEYVNGKWYIGEEAPPALTVNNMNWNIGDAYYGNNNYIEFILSASTSIPDQQFQNITVASQIDYEDASADNQIYFYNTGAISSTRPLTLCTVPTTTVNNIIYTGCVVTLETDNSFTIQQLE